MSSNEDTFTLNKIKEYKFISSSDAYYIYEELDKPCEKIATTDACHYESISEWQEKPEIELLLKSFYSSLYKIISTTHGSTNDYYDHDKHGEIKKMGIIYLKYWLYDQILKKEFDDLHIENIFQGIQNYLKRKIETVYPNSCNFNKLTLSEIKSIKKLYALYTIFYGNNNNSGSCNSEQCKYIDYFGEGLDEFISSINKCSSEGSEGNYCKEFDEFINICKNEGLNAGITVHDESTKSKADDDRKYLLFSEKYKDNPLHIYLKDKKMLNYVKTSNFISSKYRTTIAATSVVGSAIGLSSIFYYFYKFTPFGSSLRKGKGKNIVNIDEEAHNSLLYTSDTEQIPFQNREYKVAYHTI